MNANNNMAVIKNCLMTSENYKLEYILYKNELNSPNAPQSDIYSIFTSISSDSYYDEKLVWDITRDPKLAADIFDKVSKMLVCPCTLCDVISDLLL